MALRDQPYLPLYIQDFLTDEKLAECSASSTGVYIRIMCLMHKSDHYGKLFLKQKHKQSGKQISDFASMIAKQVPYEVGCVLAAITELLEEKVLYLEDDFLVQKRMVHDNKVSLSRSDTGSLGGKKTQENNRKLAKAKNQANTEYEYIDIIDSETEISEPQKKDYKMVVVEMYKVWQKANPMYPKDEEKDYSALLQFAYKIAEAKGWKRYDILSKREYDVLNSWGKICDFIMSDSWLRTKPLSTCLNQWQRIYQEMLAANGQTSMEKNRIKHEDYFDK